MKEDLTFKDIHIGFKTVQGNIIEDLESYIYKIVFSDKVKLAGHKFKISIGTDSLFSPKKEEWAATYMSVIAFTYADMGTHLIFRKDILKGPWSNKLDLFTRLWREVQMCGDLAIWIKETTEIIPEVHLDINPNQKYGSNVIFAAAKGYISSLGFDVQLKPDAAIASSAADHYLNF